MKTIKKENMYYILLFSTLFLSIIPNKFYIFFIVSYYVIFFCVAIKRIDISILLIAFTAGFSGVIRLNEFNNPLFAGFTTLEILIAFCVYLLLFLKYKLNTKIRVNKQLLLPATSLIVYLMWILVRSISDGIDMLRFLFTIREYIVPFLLLPILITVLMKDMRMIKKIALFFFMGTTIVAFLNIIHYFFGLNLEISRVITFYNDKSIFETRVIAGYPIPRMQHILGLSSQGAGSAFYIISAVLGVMFLSKIKSPMLNIISITAIFIHILPVVLMASFTGIVTLFFLFAMYLFLFKSKLKIVASIFSIPLLFFLFFTPIIETGGINSNTLFEYILFMFNEKVMTLMNGLNYNEIFFGTGMGLRGGNAIGVGDIAGTDKSLYFTDRWVFNVFFQLGVVGFILAIILTIAPIIYIKRVTKFYFNNDIYLYYVPSILLFGSLSFAHGYMLTERLFSILIVFSYAMIYVLYSQRKIRLVPELCG